MEVEVKVKRTVTHLLADMGVRYWEDSTINGVEDDADAPNMPMKKGDAWCIKIDLQTGKIEGWPEGVKASTYYKVCDGGIYSLLAEDGSVVVTVCGYVPRMLSPKENGDGDYVIMDIGPDGVIDGWRADLEYFEETE